tara:strand:+ start:52 stop:318 length:267 start_codon:yes stop_codon:yes gene_type:complete
MKYEKINQRNLLLLSGASNNLSLTEVNNLLSGRMMKPINYLNWSLWVNFYLPLATFDVLYEQEIIYNNRSISWFARDLKKRYNKKSIS